MRKNIIAMLVIADEVTPKLVDISTDFDAVSKIIGGNVVECQLDEEEGEIVVALCIDDYSEIINRYFWDIAIVGFKFLVVGKSKSGYRSLTALEINNFTAEFSHERSLYYGS
jgi:hypothetical protein